MYPPLELIHKRCTLSYSKSTTQVYVSSTCTTKDVPSNVLRQSSQTVSPLKLCEGETKDILGGQSFEIFCLRGREESKEFSGSQSFEFSWKERRETQKNSGGQSFYSFGKGRREEKIAHFCFLQNFHLQKNKVWKNKTQKDFWQKKNKKRDEQKGILRSSQKLLKSCKSSFECKSRSYFYRLFMSGQENHWKSYNLEKNLKTIGRVTSLDFLFKTCH